MQILKRIYLSEIAPFIGRRDSRSVKKWCRKNGLRTHKDCSGEFVFEKDFELAYEAPLIKELKNKHGDDWIKIYEAYKTNSLHTHLGSPKEALTKTKRYIPKGRIALQQLSKKENS